MSLRTMVYQGGLYLVVRQLVGMVVALGGMMVLTRTIGPGPWGVYVAASAAYAYVSLLCQWGINTYLIRHDGEIDDADWHQAFTLLVILGVVGLAVSAAGLPLVDRWLQFDDFDVVSLAVFAALPLNLASLVPVARLERNLDYKRIAVLELTGQVGFYAAAIAVALNGYGVWAPVAGWWAQQVLGGILPYIYARHVPRLVWRWERVRALMGFGFSYQASVLVWQLRQLVNPLIVGRFVGAEAVGLVALAIRLVEALSFIKTVTWRLSVAALAKLNGDRPRLARAVAEGMRLQVLALAPALVGFSIAAPFIVPMFFGAKWLTMLEVYPFIAVGYLANGAFNMHYSALYALKDNWPVAVFRTAHVILFAGGALVLVPLTGMIGYGLAEAVALLSYIIIHRMAVKRLGAIDWTLAVAWVGAASVALFWPQLGLWAALGPVAALAWPETWRVLGSIWGHVRALKRA
ncbi:MAG TPA: oligosaccharide flippase family protein [Azospirillaceae bacterium]|nr:oligosaccharide flippase family protein [Azospirillaceae bacterium]